MRTLSLSLELMALLISGPPPIAKQCPDPPPIRLTYADFLARVEKLRPGETLTLSVGQPGEHRCDNARTFGISDGVYSCWYDGTHAKMQRIVAAVPTFATQRYNIGSSNCPNGQCPTPRR